MVSCLSHNQEQKIHSLIPEKSPIAKHISETEGVLREKIAVYPCKMYLKTYSKAVLSDSKTQSSGPRPSTTYVSLKKSCPIIRNILSHPSKTRSKLGPVKYTTTKSVLLICQVSSVEDIISSF